jgi:hypothetical protein
MYSVRTPSNVFTSHRPLLPCPGPAPTHFIISAGRCTALHCSALLCTALHCTALHCTALHCTALHCTALHCTALHLSVEPCRLGAARHLAGRFQVPQVLLNLPAHSAVHCVSRTALKPEFIKISQNFSHSVLELTLDWELFNLFPHQKGRKTRFAHLQFV